MRVHCGCDHMFCCEVWVLSVIAKVLLLVTLSTSLPHTSLLPLRDFLPRGSGIVTRRPLILQLMNAKAGNLYMHMYTLYTVEPLNDDILKSGHCLLSQCILNVCYLTPGIRTPFWLKHLSQVPNMSAFRGFTVHVCTAFVSVNIGLMNEVLCIMIRATSPDVIWETDLSLGSFYIM